MPGSGVAPFARGGALAPSQPVWGKGKWIVPLATPHEVLMRIRYVERNPAAAGLRRGKSGRS